MSGKVSLNIEGTHQPIEIRKRKRRWIYYGLCVLISFIISRIVLIIFSIANFDLKDYAINQINYSTKKAKAIYVEAIHCNAYSPLNAQILEGVVSFYSNSKEYNTKELMAELHIPLIHIEKYKNLQFKGNVVWKNVRPRVIWKFRKFKNDLSVFFAGNVWFRFCYIKFWKSHSDEVNFSYPFGAAESNQGNLPIHIKKVDGLSFYDSVQFDVELELLDFKVPTYLNVFLDNVGITFGGDFPCKITLFNQEISNGKILNSIVVRITIEKSFLHIYKNTLWKVFNSNDFLWILAFIDISKDRINIDKTYSINIKDYIKRENLIKEETKPNKKPYVIIKDFEIVKDKILGQVDIDLNIFPYISSRTIFTFRNFTKIFILKSEDKIFSNIHLNCVDANEFLRINFEVEIINFLDLISNIRSLRYPMYLTDVDTNGFFKGFYLKYDGKSLVFFTTNNFYLIYQKNMKSSFLDFHANFSHSIDSFENIALICSSWNIGEFKTEFISPLVYLNLPRLHFKVSNNFFECKITIIEGDYTYYKHGGIQGIFRSEVEIKFSQEFINLDTKKLPLPSYYLIHITDQLEYTIFLSEDQKNGKSSFILNFNSEELEISLLDILDVNPFKFGMHISQPLGYSLPSKHNFYIENKINISKGPFLRLMFSGAEFVDETHVILSEDCELSCVIIDKNIFFAISNCSLEISLFSIQELRILITDFFKFGNCSNALGTILSYVLNNSFDNKNKQMNVIDSTCFAIAKVDHIGFGDEAITEIIFELKFNQKIINSLKFRKINFNPVKIFYKIDNIDDNLASLSMTTKHCSDYVCLTFNAQISKKLFTTKAPCSLFVNYNSTICKSLERDLLLKTIRSFFILLWAKDKTNNDDIPVLTNLILDASDTQFRLTPELQSSEMSFIVENYGLRDFLRYSVASMISKIFKCIPNKLELDLKAQNLDIFALEFLKGDKYNKSIEIAFTDLTCVQSFELVDEDTKTEEKTALNNIKNIDYFNGEIYTKTQFTIESNSIFNLLYGLNNKYGLKLNFKLKLKDDGTKEIPGKNLKFNYDFFESIFELIRDDATPIDANIKSYPILYEISSIKIFIGLNYNIKFPKNIKLVGNCKELDFCVIDLNNHKGIDGYVTLNIKNVLKILLTISNLRIILLKEDVLQVSLKHENIVVQYGFDLRGLLYRLISKLNEGLFEKCQQGIDFCSKYIEKGYNFLHKKENKTCDNENCNEHRIMMLS